MAGTSKTAEKTKVMVAVYASKEDPGIASSSSKAVFDWTMDKIIRTNGPGFNVIVVHGNEAPKCRFFHSLLRTKAHNYKKLAEEAPEPAEPERGGTAFLDGYKARFRLEGIDFQEHLILGDPKKEICAAVEYLKPDLLVVGKSGRSTFQRLFQPSVYKYCAKYAECPVIGIKPPAAERTQAVAKTSERKQARAEPGPLLHEICFLSEKEASLGE